MPRRNGENQNERKAIQQGDSGIWATCNKGRERQCVGELRDLFAEYADTLYGDTVQEETTAHLTPDPEVLPSAGIESEIQDEVTELKQPGTKQLFTPIRIDVQCGEYIMVDPRASLMRIQSSSSRLSLQSIQSHSSRPSARMQ